MDIDVREYLEWLHAHYQGMPSTFRTFVMCALIKSRLIETSELDVYATVQKHPDFTEHGYRDNVDLFEKCLVGAVKIITDKNSIHKQTRRHCAESGVS